MKKAHKRLETILAMAAGQKRLWSQTKEYSVGFHYKETNENSILLDPEKFKGIEKNEFIEIKFVSKEINLIFQFDKSKNFRKIKENVSLVSSFIEAIKEYYNYVVNKSFVFVTVPKKEDYKLKEVNIIIKEKQVPKQEIYLIIKRMLNHAIHQNQEIEIFNQEKGKGIVIGNISKLILENNKSTLTGITTWSTNFKISSSSFDLVFLIEISKNSFDYNSNLICKFELLVDYFRCILSKIRYEEPYKSISLIFYSRIYYKTTKNLNECRYLNKSTISIDEYFIDLYSEIKTFTLNEATDSEIFQNINETFFSFKNIHSDKDVSLYFFLNSIKDKFKFSFSNYQDNYFKDLNAMSMNNFYEKITEFYISKSYSTNFLESVNYILAQINKENSTLGQFGTIVNVILSGGYFPYYNAQFSEIINRLQDKSIQLSFTILDKSKKFLLYQNSNKPYSFGEKKDNLSSFSLHNTSLIPPYWCNIYCASEDFISSELEKINGTYTRYSPIGLVFKDIEENCKKNYLIDDDLYNFLPKKSKSEDNTNNLVNNNNQIKQKIKVEDIARLYNLKVKSNNINYDLIEQYDKEIDRISEINPMGSKNIYYNNEIDNFYEVIHYSLKI